MVNLLSSPPLCRCIISTSTCDASSKFNKRSPLSSSDSNFIEEMKWWVYTLHHSPLQRFIQCCDGEIHYTTVHYNFPYINLLQLLTHYSIFFFPPALMKSYLFISALFIILPSSSSHFFKKEFNTVQLANQQRKVDNFNPLDCFKKQSYNLMSTKKKSEIHFR